MLETYENPNQIMQQWNQHPRSMKIPYKNRGRKNNGPKSRKIEAWSVQGPKTSLRVSRKSRANSPGDSLHTNKKIEDCIQVIPHAGWPLAPRISHC